MRIMTVDTMMLVLGILGFFLAVLGFFATILITSLSGTVAILWKIAKIDKDKVDWASCNHMREQCPCKQDIQELKSTLNNRRAKS